VRAGDNVEIRALHADGTPYRWWQATVEQVNPDTIVVTWPEGTIFEAPTPERVKIGRRRSRCFFWFHRPYIVTESYGPGGDLVEIFADISSPARIHEGAIVFTDYELDVVWRAGATLVIEDEDEFREAAQRYGYTDEFQAECWRLVDRVREVVDAWRPIGPGRRQD
jgi:protein associated with RNAse G/E